MLDLRIVNGSRVMRVKELPLALGRPAAIAEVGDQIEALIAFLDHLTGDPDAEDDDDDCCDAGDDEVRAGLSPGERRFSVVPSLTDLEDAEHDYRGYDKPAWAEGSIMLGSEAVVDVSCPDGKHLGFAINGSSFKYARPIICTATFSGT